MKTKNRFVQAWDAFWGSSGLTAKRAFQSDRKGGAGSASDVVENMRLNVCRGLNKAYLETLYVNFWAAAKIVDLKPDDVFGPGIVWGEDEDDAAEKMQEEMKRLDFMCEVRKAVKAARLFGTALLILAPKDKNFTKPLLLDDIQEGDISHLIVADRFRLEDWVAYGDPTHPKFGKTHIYRWYFREVTGTMSNEQTRPVEQHIDIHESRCIRFDGIPPTTTDGWDRAGEERWGVSVLARALDDILQDAALAAALPDLAHRASIPVIRKSGWTEALAREGDAPLGEISPEQAVQEISDNMATAKLMIIDKEDEVDKLDVTIAGLNDIAKTATHRLAMIDGIPITRFTGESATGLSATGEGDARDWRITVESYRRDSIEPQWEMLMEAVAKNAGLDEVPDWEWGVLGDQTFDEKVGTMKTLAEGVKGLVSANVIEVEEGREILNESDLINVDPEDVPEVDVEMMATAPGSVMAPKTAPKQNFGGDKK